MNIHFQIHYRAEYGQSLCVIETQDPVVGWTEKARISSKMSCGTKKRIW